jgi:hypothetical protein
MKSGIPVTERAYDNRRSVCLQHWGELCRPMVMFFELCPAMEDWVKTVQSLIEGCDFIRSARRSGLDATVVGANKQGLYANSTFPNRFMTGDDDVIDLNEETDGKRRLHCIKHIFRTFSRHYALLLFQSPINDIPPPPPRQNLPNFFKCHHHFPGWNKRQCTKSRSTSRHLMHRIQTESLKSQSQPSHGPIALLFSDSSSTSCIRAISSSDSSDSSDSSISSGYPRSYRYHIRQLLKSIGG